MLYLYLYIDYVWYGCCSTDVGRSCSQKGDQKCKKALTESVSYQGYIYRININCFEGFNGLNLCPEVFAFKGDLGSCPTRKILGIGLTFDSHLSCPYRSFREHSLVVHSLIVAQEGPSWSS